MSNKFEYVIYHSPCNDGFGGAFSAWLTNKSAEFIGLEPRNNFPVELFDTLKGKSAIMIDIAFGRDTMIKLNEYCSNFVVLDHHKTSRDALEGLEFAKFDMNKSGCVMAWEYFHSDKQVPKFLEYIGLRDIWKHKNNPNALYFTTAFPGTHTFEAYNEYYMNPKLVTKTIQDGQKQHSNIMDKVAKIAKTAKLCQWIKYKTYIVNIGYPLLSEVGDYISNNDRSCIVLLWSKTEGKNCFSYSLRSHSNDNPLKEGPDVSAIAKLYGGGGHKHAAGFSSNKSPDELIES